MRVLEFFKEAGNEAVDIIALSNAFNRGIKGCEYEIDAIARRRRKRHMAHVENQKAYAIISRLKKNGFIFKEDKRWSITRAGRALYEKLLSRYMPRSCYVAQPSAVFMIITFDIPEKERRKRDWLRSALRSLGFTMLRQSVWVGKMGIPEDFMHDLERLRMREYVDILSVNKQGTVIR